MTSYEDLNKINEDRISRAYNIQNIILMICISVLIILSFINLTTLKIELVNLWGFLVPLIAYVFYDVFYRVEIEYTTFQKIVLILSITSFIIGVAILSFYSHEWLHLLVNMAISILVLMIIYTLSNIMYIRLIAFSIDDVYKKVTKVIFKETIDQKENKKNREHNKTLVISAIEKLNYWFRVTPSRIKILKIGKVLELIEYLYNSAYQYMSADDFSDKDDFEKILEMIDKVEVEIIILAVSNKSSKLIYSFVNHRINRLKMLLSKNDYHNYRIQIKELLYEILESFIQDGYIKEFSASIGMLCSLMDKKINDEISRECLEVMSSSIDSSVTLLGKYLDNIDIISGKFVLQLIAQKYHVISKRTSCESVNTYLFDLIDLLISKDNNKATMKIYYIFLSKILRGFTDIDDQVDFLKDIIYKLGGYEDEISPLVFNDLHILLKDVELRKAVEITISVHRSIKGSTVNMRSNRIFEFLINAKYDKSDDEIINSLTYLLTHHTDYGKYLFSQIIENIKRGKYSLIDIVETNYSILFKFQSKIIGGSSLYTELNEFISNMLRVNSEVLKLNNQLVDKSKMNRYFENTIELLDKYYRISNNVDNQVAAIDWIRDFATSNMYNDRFKTVIKTLYHIGNSGLEQNFKVVVEHVSSTFGWTLFEAFDEGNIKEESINNAFHYLVKYFKKSITIYNDNRSIFIGTAIIINYIRAIIKMGNVKTNHTIKNHMKNLIMSDLRYKDTLNKALAVKEDLLEHFFNNELTKANDIANDIKKMF